MKYEAWRGESPDGNVEVTILGTSEQIQEQLESEPAKDTFCMFWSGWFESREEAYASFDEWEETGHEL